MASAAMVSSMRILLAAGLAAPLLVAATGAARAQADGHWHSGQEAYAKDCSYCHETGVGPMLRGRGLPADYVATVPRHGLRAMPAFRASEIDDRTLAELAKFLANAPGPGQ